MWVLNIVFLIAFVENFDGMHSFRQNFWRTQPSHPVKKCCPHLTFHSCASFWRIASAFKISVKGWVWREISPSKKSSKSYWRRVSPSKRPVRKTLTDCQSVKNYLSNFFDGSVKKSFRRSFFWLTFFLSKFPSKITFSVKNSTFFRQKFHQKTDLQPVVIHDIEIKCNFISLINYLYSWYWYFELNQMLLLRHVMMEFSLAHV